MLQCGKGIIAFLAALRSSAVNPLDTEISRRRTFAIISHPDAGKTTLTEKLLWFGGAIQVAGEVRARKASRHATSDWMELEKQRGISVTSSVMQFPYRECMVNLLDEIESVLGIQCAPMTWPIGMGKRFRGVYHLYDDSIAFFDPQAEKGTAEIISGLDNPRLDELIGAQADELRTDIELVRGASHAFDAAEYLAGKQTPVFFGSAVNNFGVQSLLDAVVDLSPAPIPRPAVTREVQPNEPKFSGFVFKIQANMDPRHRDRIAFLRVCSGRFDRGMKVRQVATGKTLAINNAITFMARDRTTTDEAWPGDIIGIPNHGTIRLGETFSEGEDLRFTGIPSFAPEHFRLARIANPLKIKQLQKGLQQLAEEGATQLFRPLSGTDLILGAVGTLQFDVVANRLENEYGVLVIFEHYNCATARWIHGDPGELRQLSERYSANVALDGADDPVYLAPNNVYLNMVKEKFPNLRFEEAREVA